MMSIFGTPFYTAPRHQHTSEPSLVPLFRLLDDFDSYNSEVCSPEPKRRRQSVVPAPPRLPRFKPKFDIRETENAYELHGELPGIERENLTIEFSDPRTIEIRGKVERTKEQQPPQAEEEQQQQQQTTPEVVTEQPAEKTRRNSHQATVEDDPEETSSTNSWTPVSSPKPEQAKHATTSTNTTSEVQSSTPAPKKEVAKTNQPKIWLWERSIGEFSRTFEFPTDVEHEGVSASLNNGILSVTVPKKTMRAPRRIAIL